jgi:hypothetical protein
MSEEKEQVFWAPRTASVHFQPSMRLAPSEQERLRIGLEEFVNCGDSVQDYEALGRNWPDFWPIKISNYPNFKPSGPLAIRESIPASLRFNLPEGIGDKTDLAWHSACHKLFLFYRDTLRKIWPGERLVADLGNSSPLGWIASPSECVGEGDAFLLGLTDFNEEALEVAKRQGRDFSVARPHGLDNAWLEICAEFPTARVEGRARIGMLWEVGDFVMYPRNDFEKAFYRLFRQSWRARICPRCNKFFVARKPKQSFCGTGCSAGNRLASKRKWWNRLGAKRRAKQRQKVSERNRRERKSR